MALLIVLFGALAVFVVGNLVRILRIATMPVHLRWELYPVPHELRARARYGGSYFEEVDWWTKSMKTNRTGELRVMLAEVFLLKGVWKHNRELWLWSWFFHLGLYLLIGQAVLAMVCAYAGHAGALGAYRALRPLSAIISWLAVLSGTAGTLGLLVCRGTSLKLRPFTSTAAYFNLSLIFLIFASGLLSLFVGSAAVDDMISLAGGLLMFHAAPDLHGVAAAHVLLLALFLAYFPFTHMTHMYMKYFAYHAVCWDDAPYRPGTRIHASIVRSLSQPVSWASPHIRADGKKTWIDIASEEVNSCEKKP